MKNLFKGLFIMAVYAIITIATIGVIDFGWEITTKTIMPNMVSILIGLVIGLVIVAKTINLTLREVDGNNVLLTINVLSPQKIGGGQTKFNEYTSGFHFVFWWEKDQETVNLERDITDRIQYTISTADDEMQISLQYDVEPDPCNLSVYIMNGKDEKEREKNIALRVSTTLKRAVETYFAQQYSDDIMQNANGITDGLQPYLIAVIQCESQELGIRIKKVRVGDINYSKSVSDARNDRKTIMNRIDAAKLIAKETGISKEEALAFIQAETGKAKKVIFDIRAPKGFKGLLVGGSGEEIFGGKRGK